VLELVAHIFTQLATVPQHQIMLIVVTPVQCLVKRADISFGLSNDTGREDDREGTSNEGPSLKSFAPLGFLVINCFYAVFGIGSM
jgi:hypothetical protein